MRASYMMWIERHTVDAISDVATGSPADQHSPKGALLSVMGVSPS